MTERTVESFYAMANECSQKIKDEPDESPLSPEDFVALYLQKAYEEGVATEHAALAALECTCRSIEKCLRCEAIDATTE